MLTLNPGIKAKATDSLISLYNLTFVANNGNSIPGTYFIKMDVFFNKTLENSLLLLRTDGIKRIVFDRIILMNVISDVLKKLKMKPNPYAKDIRIIVKYELMCRNKRELLYLIGEDDQWELSGELCGKLYLGWFTLMSISVVFPKWANWIREQETNLIVVLMSRSDGLLHDECDRIAMTLKHFEFASADEVHKIIGHHVDPSKTYVKVHCSKMIANLCKEYKYCNIIRDGFCYIEYKPDMNLSLFACAIEQEWERMWHTIVPRRNELFKMFKDEETVRDIEKALSEPQSIEPAAPAMQRYPQVSLSITLPELHQMAQKYFPPCMTNMLAAFMSTGELKHDARKQLTLFLKDIGVPRERILMLYEYNYSRPTLVDKKESVLYFMRHLLGLINTRNLYKSYNCQQIQDHSGNESRVHGCYFKKKTVTEMNADMTNLNFYPSKRLSVIKTLKNEGCTAACSLHLQIRFSLNKLPRDLEKPNDYYHMARCTKPCSKDIDIEDFITSDDDEIFSQYPDPELDDVQMPSKRFKK